MYAFAAGSAAGWLRGRSGFVWGERYATGGVLVGLGLLTAFSGAKSNP
jgi:threonine/homoserine/homoserine lactone efflux protein